MKKFFIAWSLIISNSLFGANCDNLLNEGVAKGYTDPDNTLRYSVVADPAGKPLPNGVDLKDKFIYYVGPVDPVKGEVVDYLEDYSKKLGLELRK
ncbi:hypothetical protein AS859_11215, partial [Aliarcobacter cryaerophilus]